MSTERYIINRLMESRRLDEAWPPILNRLTNYQKNLIRKKLNRLDIDIENTPAKNVVITNGRDPRLKGKNVVIFELEDNGLAVWVDGEFVKDDYSFSAKKNISKMSWKDILAFSKRIISMEFDEGTSNAMKQKKADRKEAQKGMVVRHKPGDLKNKTVSGRTTTWKAIELDKSGYVKDPDKYKNMLAAANINNGPQLLKAAKEMYVKLANNLDVADLSNQSFDSYDYIMRNMIDIFRNLSKSLKDYEEAKKSGDPDSREWAEKWHRDAVVSNIKELKELMLKAKKFL